MHHRHHLAPILAAAVAVAAAGSSGCRDVKHSILKTSGESTSAIASAAPPVPTPPVLPGSADVASLVATVKPAVVNITTTHAVRSGIDLGPFGFDPFGGLGPFGGKRRGDVLRKEKALGSGFIIDKSGYVVTNAHVVEDADDVRVVLADDREFRAKVRGRDRTVDLALLKLEGAKDLPTAVLGSSEALKVGEYVVAIGNPFGLGHTVTMGIVSAKGRAIGAGPYDDFIQTDASINPGNSGGPLFNLRGEVVGINTAINPAGRGIGFAAPVDTLKLVLDDLKTTGHVERARLGVAFQHVDAALASAIGLDRPRGALVAEVEKSGPAATAGIREGDVITAVNGVEIAHAEDLPRTIAKHKPGTTVKIELLRDRDKKTVEAKLAALDDSADDATAPPGTDGETRPGLGIAIADAPNGGAVVQLVHPEGAAAGKLESGDIVLEVNHRRVDDAAELKKAIRDAKKGEALLLKVRRDGHTRFVVVERP